MSETATTPLWTITQLEREVIDGYVFVAHYNVSLQDDVYSASAYGAMGFERPEGDLIPFSDLTEEVVVGWLKDKFGEEKVTEIEAALQVQLDYQRHPTTAAGLPWS
jgi:hypothetical protein